MATRKKRLQVGDVLAVTSKIGVTYLIYVGQNESFGDVVLVAPASAAGNSDWGSVLFSEGYFVPYPARQAVAEGLIKIVGHTAAPTMPSVWRRPGRIANSGKIENWMIEESGKSYVVRELTSAQAKIPIESVLSHSALVERIELGWRPEQSTDSLSANANYVLQDTDDSHLDSKRTIRHFVYFNDRAVANEFARMSNCQGYIAHVEPGVESFAFVVQLSHGCNVDTLERDLNAAESFIDRALKDIDGLYDGHEVSM